jgi:hypothetical protein
VPPQDRFQTLFSNVAMHGRWECSSVVSTKISFNQTELMQPGRLLVRVAIGDVGLCRRDFSPKKQDGAHRPHEGQRGAVRAVRSTAA